MDGALVLGTAGSGKTTLTGNYVRWLRQRFSPLRACAVNLDPGAMELPYEPAYDIRSIVNVLDVMRNEGLGPNGALVRSMELVLENLDSIADSICSLSCDAVLIDTPGQMEVFAFRPVGRRLCETLSRCVNLAALFLGDYERGREGEDLVAAALLGKLLELKLGIPVIPVLNKMDVWDREDVHRLWERVLRGELTENVSSGVIGDALAELVRAVAEFRSPVRVIPISALRGDGFDEIFDALSEVWCSCGDMT